jgi:hypothetical protein
MLDDDDDYDEDEDDGCNNHNDDNNNDATAIMMDFFDHEPTIREKIEVCGTKNFTFYLVVFIVTSIAVMVLQQQQACHSIFGVIISFYVKRS